MTPSQQCIDLVKDFEGFREAAEVEAGGLVFGLGGGGGGVRGWADDDLAWRDAAGGWLEFVADAIADFLAERRGLAEGEQAKGARRSGLFFRLLGVERAGGGGDGQGEELQRARCHGWDDGRKWRGCEEDRQGIRGQAEF